MNIKTSAEMHSTIIVPLNELSAQKFHICFNDLYKVKSGVVRRWKISCCEWINKSDSDIWKIELEKLFPTIKFKCVNKLISMGGKKWKELNKQAFIKDGGTAEEYENTFNNQDYYFVITMKNK